MFYLHIGSDLIICHDLHGRLKCLQMDYLNSLLLIVHWMELMVEEIVCTPESSFEIMWN